MRFSWRPCLAAALAALLAANDAVAAVSRVESGTRLLRDGSASAAPQIQKVPPELLFSGSVGDSIAEWTPPLLEAVQSPEPAELTPPESLRYRSSARQRFENADAADRLKYPMFGALPEILGEVRVHAQGGSKASLQQILDRFRGIIERRYGTGEGVVAVRNKMERKLTDQWADMRSGISLDGFEVGGAMRAAEDFKNAFDGARDRFDGGAKDIFTPEVRAGSAFGNLGSRVILASLGYEPASPQSVLALTLLHPITDDALDHGTDVGKSMGRITEVLKGKPLEPANDYEKVVFTLIGDIYSSYSPTEHPALAQILLLLHQAQLESAQLQKSGSNVDRTKLFELTARKGGLTALALAYVSLGTLRLDEMQFFYKSGMLFQLGDDLMDVREDARDGTTTAWTLAVRSRSAYRSMIQRFFTVQQFLERSAPQVLSNHPLKDAFVNDLKLAFRFYLFASFLNPELDRLNGTVLKELTPLSPGNIRSIAFSLFKGLKREARRSATGEEADAIDFFGRVFDKHFLGGAYGRFERATRWFWPRYSYRITHPNPLFAWVALKNRLRDFIGWYLQTAFRGGSKRGPNVLGAFMLVGIFALYGALPAWAIHGEPWRTIAACVMVVGGMHFLWGEKNLQGLIIPGWALVIELALVVIDLATR